MSSRILASLLASAVLGCAVDARATTSRDHRCVAAKDKSGTASETERIEAQDEFEEASREFDRATVALDDAHAAHKAALENITAEGGAQRARETAQAIVSAEKNREVAREKKECLERARDVVHRLGVYNRALGFHFSFAPGATESRFGGGVSFAWRPSAATEWEVGASLNKLGELGRSDERAWLVGVPFRVFFGRESLSHSSTAFYLGPNIEVLPRAEKSFFALAGQLGLRFHSRSLAPPGTFWDIRTFVEPRIAEDISGLRPFSVLFGFQLGFAHPWSSELRLNRWEWKVPEAAQTEPKTTETPAKGVPSPSAEAPPSGGKSA